MKVHSNNFNKSDDVQSSKKEKNKSKVKTLEAGLKEQQREIQKL